MKITTSSEAETAQAAKNLADTLKGNDIITLSGALGMGKSVFARALIRSLCGDNGMDVPSPTFTLVQTYEGSTGIIHHFDLYRLENAEEIFELGWDDALTSGITIVEWPERLGKLLPAARTDIKFSGAGNTRTIDIIRMET